MKIQISKETMVNAGNAGLKLGKHILIEGTKAVAIKAAAKAINVGFEEGFDSVKSLTLDEVLESNKKGKSKPKRKMFGKKEEVVDELIEEIVLEPETAEEVVEVTEKA